MSDASSFSSYKMALLCLGFPQKNAERRRQESIEETERECERQAAAEAAKVAEIHRKKCDELNER